MRDAPRPTLRAAPVAVSPRRVPPHPLHTPTSTGRTSAPTAAYEPCVDFYDGEGPTGTRSVPLAYGGAVRNAMWGFSGVPSDKRPCKQPRPIGREVRGAPCVAPAPKPFRPPLQGAPSAETPRRVSHCPGDDRPVRHIRASRSPAPRLCSIEIFDTRHSFSAATARQPS